MTDNLTERKKDADLIHVSVARQEVDDVVWYQFGQPENLKCMQLLKKKKNLFAQTPQNYSLILY